MQLTPRYDGPEVLRIEDLPVEPSVPLLRQRRRLSTFLAALDTEGWSAPSRCEGWSVQDVIAHLVGTNQFWAVSMASGLAGSPTRILAAFDPVATPARMVDDVRALSPAEVLDQFAQTTEAMANVLSGLDGDAWSTVAEAPPGHVALRAVALHALWDAWIHERDVVLPLGGSPVEEVDEVECSLRYVAALGPALSAAGGSTRCGTLGIETTDPDLQMVVEAGPTVVVRSGQPAATVPCLRGRAVDLVEALSFRLPLDHDLDDADRWLLGGLGEVFDLSA